MVFTICWQYWFICSHKLYLFLNFHFLSQFERIFEKCFDSKCLLNRFFPHCLIITCISKRQTVKTFLFSSIVLSRVPLPLTPLRIYSTFFGSSLGTQSLNAEAFSIRAVSRLHPEGIIESNQMAPSSF